MAAIVDVYDALTSDRQYHRAISPADAIRKIYGWSDTKFDRGLVQDFIRCVGIYPIGTLVLLQSGRLAVVAETNDADMLRPKVHAFYSTKSSVYIKPQRVDLSDSLGAGAGERILSHESPDKWHINPLRFLALSD